MTNLEASGDEHHQIGWPANKVIELAPANWKATLARSDVQDALLGNVFRQVALGNLEPIPQRS